MNRVLVFLIIILSVMTNVLAFRLTDTDEKHNAAYNKQQEKQRLSHVKKEIDQAKASIKSGKNLDKTETSMRKLLADTLNSKDQRIHLMLIEAIKKQYEYGNEQLFLKQKYDTANIFRVAQRMFLAVHGLDSLDALPGKSGEAPLKYRKQHASLLATYYDNLYSGGIYFHNHKNYKEAISCLDTYLEVREWPIFSSEKLRGDSLRIYHAAYISLLSGYLSKDIKGALKYGKLALRYSPKYETSLQLISDIYQLEKNEEMYLHYLSLGVDSFPTSNFFYPRLIDYYNVKGKYEKAMEVANRVQNADSLNQIVACIRQTLFLNMGMNEECINLGRKIIEKNDSLSIAYYNVGLAYYNEALEVEGDDVLKPRDRKTKANKLYEKCRPFMERFRLLAPEEKEKWKPVLYAVYLNLNMGKEFSELIEQ